ncbi:hypothetical protein EDD11_001539 [Mortierella claussenii]|nr:hypothetical protein EDD11_001539 [Mortierella claussenii]
MTLEQQHFSYDNDEGSSNSARTTATTNEKAPNSSLGLLELDVGSWSSRFSKDDEWGKHYLTVATLRATSGNTSGFTPSINPAMVNEFLLCMTESLALGPYLPDGDSQSMDAVLPLRKNPKTRESVSHIGHDYELNAEPIAFKTADMYIKAACNL